MKKTGIFYGSSTGVTEGVARKIASVMGVPESDVHDVSKSAPSEVAPYDVLLMGTSTWGAGDMQDDWYDFTDGLQALDLTGKKFSIFGCGDETMSDTFCSGMGELYERIIKTGATPIGAFNEDGFTFDNSGAIVDGNVIGLVLDEVNHPDLTDAKIKAWTDEIKKQM
ncbi:MAG: flavodoxin [Muribaculaceae bacterium]|nr:flavodoxin [Muribaculaceae bacterium]